MRKSIIIALIIILVILVVVILSLNNKPTLNLNNNQVITGSEYRVGYLSKMGPGETVVLSNYSDFEAYFKQYTNYSEDGYGNKISSSTDVILQKYNEEFFKNKSLAVGYLVLTSGSASVSYNSAKIEGTNVTINYNIEKLEIGTMDMSGYFIAVEVSKDVTSVSLNKIENK